MSSVVFFERALKLKNFLIIADLHLSMMQESSFIPIIFEKEILKDLKELKKQSKTNTLIINGDIKHDFGKEKEDFFYLSNFLDKLKEIYNQIIIIQGNHDNYIKNIALKKDITVVKRINFGNKIVITHGDYYYNDFEKNKIFIIGNEHPFLKIREYNLEIPVFLINKKLIVLPPFNKFLKGNNVLNKSFLSPYLKKIKETKIVYVENNKLINFGTLVLD